MRTETALLGLTLLSACADKGTDTGSAAYDDLSAQECLDQVDGARTETDLLLTQVWEDDGQLYFELDGNQDDLRCFVDHGGPSHIEVQQTGNVWVTPIGGSEMYLGCARACDVWEPIADCRGGFGCDTPGAESGSTVIEL